MKHRIIISLFFLGCLLFNSCLKMAPKNLENPKLKSSAYYAVGKYLNDEKKERLNRDTFYSCTALIAYQCRYSCDVPEEERVAATEVIDWYYDEDSGDDYDIYYIIYRVEMNEKNYYALISLTEFDDEENSYEYKVEDVEKSLSDMKSLLI